MNSHFNSQAIDLEGTTRDFYMTGIKQGIEQDFTGSMVNNAPIAGLESSISGPSTLDI